MCSAILKMDAFTKRLISKVSEYKIEEDEEYPKTLDKLDWKSIKFSPYDEHECKEGFKKIIIQNEIREIRSLHEILKDLIRLDLQEIGSNSENENEMASRDEQSKFRRSKSRSKPNFIEKNTRESTESASKTKKIIRDLDDNIPIFGDGEFIIYENITDPIKSPENVELNSTSSVDESSTSHVEDLQDGDEIHCMPEEEKEKKESIRLFLEKENVISSPHQKSIEKYPDSSDSIRKRKNINSLNSSKEQNNAFNIHKPSSSTMEDKHESSNLFELQKPNEDDLVSWSSVSASDSSSESEWDMESITFTNSESDRESSDGNLMEIHQDSIERAKNARVMLTEEDKKQVELYESKCRKRQLAISSSEESNDDSWPSHSKTFNKKREDKSNKDLSDKKRPKMSNTTDESDDENLIELDIINKKSSSKYNSFSSDSNDNQILKKKTNPFKLVSDSSSSDSDENFRSDVFKNDTTDLDSDSDMKSEKYSKAGKNLTRKKTTKSKPRNIKKKENEVKKTLSSDEEQSMHNKNEKIVSKKRKNIRKIMTTNDLDEATIKANIEEQMRIKRLAEKKKLEAEIRQDFLKLTTG